MCNAATWKINLYLYRAMQIGERWELLDPILMQICKIAIPGNVHENLIGALSSVIFTDDRNFRAKLQRKSMQFRILRI